MEAYMFYVWCAAAVAGYIISSIILLLLNKKWKWDWIYGNWFLEELPCDMGRPIVVAELYHDPGLMAVLALLGPILVVISLVLAAGLWIIALFMTILVSLPRHLINRRN